ncbi:hypothetical protein ACCC88_02405 [Sphingomonas sp. Sphisp140]|uniref:hypothetical protein n=1 Tax=unclassified Sphingomonas TaxID=196159 RepID=UPI0039AFBF4E
MGENSAERLDEDLKHLIEMARNKATEHRVLAIVCCAFIEDALTGVISVRLPGITPELKARMFGSEKSAGPLSAVVSKIDFAQALGALTPGAAEELRLIAQIRNRFAHRIRVASFEDSPVRDLVVKLDMEEKLVGFLKAHGAERPSAPFGQSLSGQFVFTAARLAQGLRRLIDQPTGHLSALSEPA